MADSNNKDYLEKAFSEIKITLDDIEQASSDTDNVDFNKLRTIVGSLAGVTGDDPIETIKAICNMSEGFVKFHNFMLERQENLQCASALKLNTQFANFCILARQLANMSEQSTAGFGFEALLASMHKNSKVLPEHANLVSDVLINDKRYSAKWLTANSNAKIENSLVNLAAELGIIIVHPEKEGKEWKLVCQIPGKLTEDRGVEMTTHIIPIGSGEETEAEPEETEAEPEETEAEPEDADEKDLSESMVALESASLLLEISAGSAQSGQTATDFLNAFLSVAAKAQQALIASAAAKNIDQDSAFYAAFKTASSALSDMIERSKGLKSKKEQEGYVEEVKEFLRTIEDIKKGAEESYKDVKPEEREDLNKLINYIDKLADRAHRTARKIEGLPDLRADEYSLRDVTTADTTELSKRLEAQETIEQTLNNFEKYGPATKVIALIGAKLFSGNKNTKLDKYIENFKGFGWDGLASRGMKDILNKMREDATREFPVEKLRKNYSEIHKEFMIDKTEGIDTKIAPRVAYLMKLIGAFEYDFKLAASLAENLANSLEDQKQKENLQKLKELLRNFANATKVYAAWIRDNDFGKGSGSSLTFSQIKKFDESLKEKIEELFLEAPEKIQEEAQEETQEQTQKEKQKEKITQFLKAFLSYRKIASLFMDIVFDSLSSLSELSKNLFEIQYKKEVFENKAFLSQTGLSYGAVKDNQPMFKRVQGLDTRVRDELKNLFKRETQQDEEVKRKAKLKNVFYRMGEILKQRPKDETTQEIFYIVGMKSYDEGGDVNKISFYYTALNDENFVDFVNVPIEAKSKASAKNIISLQTAARVRAGGDEQEIDPYAQFEGYEKVLKFKYKRGNLAIQQSGTKEIGATSRNQYKSILLPDAKEFFEQFFAVNKLGETPGDLLEGSGDRKLLFTSKKDLKYSVSATVDVAIAGESYLGDIIVGKEELNEILQKQLGGPEDGSGILGLLQNLDTAWTQMKESYIKYLTGGLDFLDSMACSLAASNFQAEVQKLGDPCVSKMIEDINSNEGFGAGGSEEP